jgi:hypothetical protein
MRFPPSSKSAVDRIAFDQGTRPPRLGGHALNPVEPRSAGRREEAVCCPRGHEAGRQGRVIIVSVLSFVVPSAGDVPQYVSDMWSLAWRMGSALLAHSNR